VWVGELGVHEELEVLVVLHLLVTHLDVVVAALLEGGPAGARTGTSTGGEDRMHTCKLKACKINQRNQSKTLPEEVTQIVMGYA
jgi:hypothetical protein